MKKKATVLHWALLGASVSVGVWLWKPWSPVSRLTLSPAAGYEPIPDHVGDIKEGFKLEVVIKGLSLPWDLAFLDEDHVLVTEKAGKLWKVDLKTAEKVEIQGVPTVRVQGQGGLHVVLVHPQFPQNHSVYLSYAAPVGSGASTTISSARLEGNRLEDVRQIFQAKAPIEAGVHFGGAMALDGQGHLFFSVGDRGHRDDAQLLTSHNGKIMRLREDGRLPDDNPFIEKAGALPEIWSYGHRNPQGLAFDPATGALWESEHGPQGGDEVNVVERGRNYGWPLITFGREYGSGLKIGQGTERSDVRAPVHHYIPSIGTAGVAVYRGAAFPGWAGNVFVGALHGHLNKVTLSDRGAFEREDRLLNGQGLRIRSVRISPSGIPYVTVDNGALVRLVPERIE